LRINGYPGLPEFILGVLEKTKPAFGGLCFEWLRTLQLCRDDPTTDLAEQIPRNFGDLRFLLDYFDFLFANSNLFH
jgi:hypothetical protein